jgi:hypothetical protein
MPRTDRESGKELQPLLEFVLDLECPQPIYEALGYSSSRYYRRNKKDDYPNAEELRLVAERFGLDPVDLMARFGLIGSGPDFRGRGATVTKHQRLAKTPKLRRRADAPAF